MENDLKNMDGFTVSRLPGRLCRLVLPVLVLCCFLVLFSGPGAGAAEQVSHQAKQSQAKQRQVKQHQVKQHQVKQRYVTIDFNDVDINLFIKYISELTGKNFVVDRAVKGKVTILSPTRISVKDAYRVFESVLEVHGYTTVSSGLIIKIVPDVEARSKGIPTIRQGGTVYPGDKMVTQLIHLKHASPEQVKKMLAPLVSRTSVVIASPDSGMLIITDVQSNIKRLLGIIKAIDVPSIGEELLVLPLQHASAVNLAKSVDQLFRQQVRRLRRREIIKIIPYERTNSLIVFASKVNVRKIRKLITRLDVEVPKGTGKIKVYYLQNANAEELVKVLTNLPAESKGSNKQKGRAPLISQNVKIMADKETNSLIIIAPRDEYPVIEDVIKKLDVPRRMVYMEALIMEVHVNKSFNIGVQWGGGGNFADKTGQVYSGFSGNPAPNQYDVLKGLQQSPAVLPAGFSFGILKQGVKIGNVYFPNLGAVLQAYKNDSDVNIIATPQILTTDNQKAEIKVGENVPYITSKNTTNSQQDYTNYEYKDVATTLDITPQINQSDLVRLKIGVEVIKLKNPNDRSGHPTTFKRSAHTTVVVHNNETVVIGGMIGQDTSVGEYKVPLLGDIPILGWLFKSHTNSKEKTNLFIFITPHIVENSAELAGMYYEKRKNIMQHVQPGASNIPADFFYKKPDPENSMALSDIGFSELRKKEYGKARQYFEESLAVDPDNPYALLNMGVVLEHEGNREQAAAMYRKVLKVRAAQPAGKGKAAAKAAAGRGLGLRKMAEDNLKRLHLPVKPQSGPQSSATPVPRPAP
ncbi:type II secretion system protein D precursor [bacterium BMS3Abin13]|nr:type II secretion system protein D precursor [bacterium BMS3Abin13]